MHVAAIKKNDKRNFGNTFLHLISQNRQAPTNSEDPSASNSRLKEMLINVHEAICSYENNYCFIILIIYDSRFHIWIFNSLPLSVHPQIPDDRLHNGHQSSMFVFPFPWWKYS